MKKTTLLSITLLLCPGLVLSMDQNNAFPDLPNLPKKSRAQKKAPKKDTALETSGEQIIKDSTPEIQIPAPLNEESIPSTSILSFASEESLPKKSYERPLLSVLWNNVTGKDAITIAKEWFNDKNVLDQNGKLKEEYHIKAKRDIVKAVEQQITTIKENWFNTRIGDEKSIFNLILSENENLTSEQSKNGHELILKLKNGLYSNKNATSNLHFLLNRSEELGIKIQESEVLQRMHQTFSQERAKLQLLFLSTFAHVQKEITGLTSGLNKIVETTPEETKLTIQKTDKSFNTDSTQYAVDICLFKTMAKNKEQIKSFLTSEKEMQEKKEQEEKSKQEKK